MIIATAAIQAALFAYIGYKDLRHGVIPNRAVLIGLLIAIVAAFLPSGIGFMAAWQGFLITAVVGIIFWKIGKLPGGDAKLFMLVGLTLGFPMMIAGIVGGWMVGAAIVLVFVIRDYVVIRWFPPEEETVIKKNYPLAPFIAISTITVLAWRVFIILVAG